MEILWCATELKGPYNGVGLYNGEKVWFLRSGNDIEVHRVPAELIQQAEENHARYCEASGAPAVHGGPRRIRMALVKKRDDVRGLSEGEELEMAPKAITDTKGFTHSYNPLDVRGEKLATLTKKQVSNYYVDQCFEYV